jgi:IS5 family transposase
MVRVVPRSQLVTQIAPYVPEGKRGLPPVPVESLLRIHFMQQWFIPGHGRSAARHAAIP